MCQYQGKMVHIIHIGFPFSIVVFSFSTTVANNQTVIILYVQMLLYGIATVYNNNIKEDQHSRQ